ncbi:MAG: hypothetical protein KDI17_07830 [Halioglobus sp.]|nr:hypothetical protein [Halioglobus sp.]
MTNHPCRLAATLLVLLAFIGGCATAPKEQPMVPFTMDGGANGDFRGPSHFVILDDETVWHLQEERIKDYVSYLLAYRGITEVDSEEEADYLVFVKYIDVAQNEQLQQLNLTAVSKRVFNALGELRPSWVALSVHYGETPAPDQMLPMHTLSLRDFVGGNPSPYQQSIGYRVDAPAVLRLMEKVEGGQHSAADGE